MPPPRPAVLLLRTIESSRYEESASVVYEKLIDEDSLVKEAIDNTETIIIENKVNDFEDVL